MTFSKAINLCEAYSTYCGFRLGHTVGGRSKATQLVTWILRSPDCKDGDVVLANWDADEMLGFVTCESRGCHPKNFYWWTPLHLQFIWPLNMLSIINLHEHHIYLDLRFVVCGLELLSNTSFIWWFCHSRGGKMWSKLAKRKKSCFLPVPCMRAFGGSLLHYGGSLHLCERWPSLV